MFLKFILCIFSPNIDLHGQVSVKKKKRKKSSVLKNIDIWVRSTDTKGFWNTIFKISICYIASVKFLKVLKSRQLLNCKASFGADTYNKSIRDSFKRRICFSRNGFDDSVYL